MKKLTILLVIGIFTLPILANAMPDPASLICSEKGGVDFYSDDGELHLCKFSDGSECEVVDLLGETCTQGQYRNWIAEYPRIPDMYIIDIFGKDNLVDTIWPAHQRGIQEGRKNFKVYGDHGPYYLAGLLVGNDNRAFGISPETQVVISKNGKILDTLDVPSIKAQGWFDNIYLYIPMDTDDEVSFSVNPDRKFEEIRFTNNEFTVTTSELKTNAKNFHSTNTSFSKKYIWYVIGIILLGSLIGAVFKMKYKKS